MNRILKTTAIAAAVMGFATAAQARDQVRIVGSSTVYPFASYVAEEFGATTDFRRLSSSPPVPVEVCACFATVWVMIPPISPTPRVA